MTNAVLFIYGIATLLGGGAVVALVWAASSGQLTSFNKSSSSIFDKDESASQCTDVFPAVPDHTNTPEGKS